MVACGSGAASGTEGTEKSEETATAASTGISITILNSKVEVQTQFEEMAEQYTKATGVNVEVYCADTDTTVSSQLSTR